MKRLFLPALVLSGLLLLGAGCSPRPLEPIEPEPANEVVTPKPAPVILEDTFNGTPAPDSGEGFPDTFNGTPAPDSGEGLETPEQPQTPVVKGTGYGGKVIGELNMKPDANSVVVFLTAEKADYKGKDAYMEFGCESLLIPIRRTVEKTQSDLALAIVELITIKETAYFDQGIRNAVAPSAPTIRLTNISYDGKTRVIDFEGQFTSAGTCDDPRIKAQIEETVKLYSSDYRIRVNGNESEWRCLFDQSGECK